MKVGNSGIPAYRRANHRNDPHPGIFGSFMHTVQKKLAGYKNVTKKDDDFGYQWNDPEAKRRGKREVPFLYRVANWNPILLIFILTVLLILFTVMLLYLLMALMGGGTSPESDIRGLGSSKSQSFKELMENKPSAKVEKAISDLLTELDGAKDDIEASMLNDWDHRFAILMNQHCLNELPFKMDYQSLQTFEAHIAYLFTSLQSKDMIHYLNPETTVITEDGTLVSKDDMARSRKKHAPCSLITGLLKKAQELQVMIPREEGVESVFDSIQDYPDDDDMFSKTNDEAWLAVKDRFIGKDLDHAAYELISLVKDSGRNLHLAKQVLPTLLTQFCPNIHQWFDEMEEVPLPAGKDDGSMDDMEDPRLEAVNSVEDLLRQLHHHGNIHLMKNEVPALDRRGFLVAVDQVASKNAGTRFSDKWTSCSFIDKVAYYRNAGIVKQTRALLNSAAEHDYFAFDNQADILMIEHCPKTVEMLSSSKKDNLFDLDDVYLNEFRGELLTFSGQIATNQYLGDTTSFVVTKSGGIMHRDEAMRTKEMYTECDIIKHLAAMDRNAGGEGLQFDENRFNPKFEGKRYESLQKELHAKKAKTEDIVQSVVQHALKDEPYELRRLTTNTLYQFHGEQIRKMKRDKVEHLLSEINQYVVALVAMDDRVWPEKHVSVIDLTTGKLSVVNKNEVRRDPNLMSSEILNKIFKAALEAPVPDNGRKGGQSKSDRGARDGRDGRDSGVDDDIRDKEVNQQLRSYVSILLRDIRRQESDGMISDEMLKDIEADLERYCGNVVGGLSPRGNRVLVSDLLASIQDREGVVRDPVVTGDGHILSRDQVDGQRDTMLQCPFITELLAQSK